jgi:hypothetical protein
VDVCFGVRKLKIHNEVRIIFTIRKETPHEGKKEIPHEDKKEIPHKETPQKNAHENPT